MFTLDTEPSVLVETEEQGQLRAVLRDLLAEDSRGDEQGLWQRLAGEIGVHGLVVPEKYGGSGYTFAELAVVLQEMGRVLCPVPLLSTVVLAGYALLDSGDQRTCERWLPGIASGGLTATVAGMLHPAAVTAERGPDGWVLRGEADFVPDGEGSDLLLVMARAPDGERVFACEPDDATCERTARRVLDPTRRQALVRLRGAPAEPITEPERTSEVIDGVLDAGRVAVAAEHVGGSAHALDAVLTHVTQRTQFGRAIGSFQAVKHRLADLLVEVEGARSASAYASACLAGRAAELAVAASAAAVACTGAHRLATTEYVQLHGGIGFTWEHSAHRYLRRARADEALFGTADDHRLRLAGLLGLTGRTD